jgi:hypothetical protein
MNNFKDEVKKSLMDTFDKFSFILRGNFADNTYHKS